MTEGHSHAVTTAVLARLLADVRCARVRATLNVKEPVMAADDLERLLADLSVRRRPGRWCFVSDVDIPDDVPVAASIVEEEGRTSVVSVADAERMGIRPDFVAAWLTLEVPSALDSVGLTAAVAGALAAEDIPCNVLAAYHHDHLLVPVDQAERAMAVLDRLAASRHRGRP
jgi:uncharacterized protein